jgi:hypothetical protein
VPTIMRDGNWTHFGDKGGRWHYTPPYDGPGRGQLAPYKGPRPPSAPSNDLRGAGNPRTSPGGTLPGPGPLAGGRYRWQGANPNAGAPAPFKNNWGNPLGQWRGSGFARMSGLLKRFGPVGQALSLLGETMPLWQTTDPDGATQPYDWAFHGWTEINRCVPASDCATIKPTRITGTYSPCSLLTAADFATVSAATPVTNRGANTWYGPIKAFSDPSECAIWVGGGSPGRFTRLRRYARPLPHPAPDIPTVNEPRPFAVQPMPADLTPPRSYPDPDPWAKALPRPGGSRPRRPPPPYIGTDHKPPVPSLPKPGEKKHKIASGSPLHDIYGGLTELKDGLKCAEKAMPGYRIPKGAGLGGRAMALAQAIHDNPNKFRPGTFLACVVSNQASDAAIGRANRLANRITQSPYYRRPVGVGFGGFSQRMG